MGLRNDWLGGNWITADNVDTMTIPAFGVCEYTGITIDKGTGRLRAAIKRPTTADLTSICVNSWKPIEPDTHGMVSIWGPVCFLYDGSTSESYGPQANSFEAKGDNWGLTKLGATDQSDLCVGAFYLSQHPYKPVIKFELTDALSTSDAYEEATIKAQLGQGFDSPSTGVGAIRVYNTYDNSESSYIFEGDVGDWGLAYWNGDRANPTYYTILNFECP